MLLIVTYHGGSATFAAGAAAAVAQAALAKLPGIGSGNVRVTSQLTAQAQNLANPGTATDYDHTGSANLGYPRQVFDSDLRTLLYPAYYCDLTDTPLEQTRPVQQVKVWATSPSISYVTLKGAASASATPTTLADAQHLTPADWVPDPTYTHPQLYSYSLNVSNPTPYSTYIIDMMPDSYNGPYPPPGNGGSGGYSGYSAAKHPPGPTPAPAKPGKPKPKPTAQTKPKPTPKPKPQAGSKTTGSTAAPLKGYAAHGVSGRDDPGYPSPTPTPPSDPTSNYGYGIAEIQLLGPPVYNGDYTVEFTRSLAGQNVDQLAVDDSSVAGVSINTAQQGHVGDWTVNLLQDVLPGQTNTVHSMIPSTTYQIRWEAVGYAPEDVTPSDPTTITTTPPEVDAMIAGAGDGGFVGQGVWSLDGDGETKSQWVKVGDTATYNIQVTNSEPTSDDFLITGPGSDAKWTVSYFDAQGHDITAAVTGAGYTAHGLGVGQTCALSVEVAPNQGVADGDTKEVLVTATIGSDTAQADAVLATTTAVTQTVAKLQYSLDDGTTWNDVPQPGDTNFPLTVDQYTYVDFRAIKTDPNTAWPDGKPVWSGEYWSGEIGEQSWEYFDEDSVDANDLKTVTAECNNTVTASIKVNAASLSLSTDTDLICAGGIASAVHQANLTATYQNSEGQPLANHIVSFSYRYTDELSFSNPVDIMTDADGNANFTLTSGQATGGIIVQALCDGAEADTTISVEPAAGSVDVITPNLVADGQSSTDVQLQLNLGDQPVDGHSISWRISQVIDEQGNIVQPDAQGHYPGYGSLSASTGITNAEGISTVTYTTGTEAGTITFEATDTTVVTSDSDPGSAQLESSASSAAGRHPNYNNAAQPNTNVPTFSISGRVTSSDGKPVKDALVGRRRQGEDIKDSITVKTNANGEYTLSNVPAGTWIVTPTKLKSDPHQREVQISDSNQSGKDFITLLPLLHPQLSQAASDALRRAGFTDANKGRIRHVISGWTKSHQYTHVAAGIDTDGHQYGNAIDIYPSSDHDTVYSEIRNLRLQGFAAWYRWQKPTNLHYHIVWAGSRSGNEDNKKQICSFKHGRVGLGKDSMELHPAIQPDEIEAVKSKYESIYGQGSLDNCEPYGRVPKK